MEELTEYEKNLRKFRIKEINELWNLTDQQKNLAAEEQ